MALLIPKNFNTAADELNLYLIQLEIRNVLNYLDDFIVIGPPNSPECGLSSSGHARNSKSRWPATKSHKILAFSGY